MEGKEKKLYSHHYQLYSIYFGSSNEQGYLWRWVYRCLQLSTRPSVRFHPSSHTRHSHTWLHPAQTQTDSQQRLLDEAQRFSYPFKQTHKDISLYIPEPTITDFIGVEIAWKFGDRFWATIVVMRPKPKPKAAPFSPPIKLTWASLSCCSLESWLVDIARIIQVEKRGRKLK